MNERFGPGALVLSGLAARLLGWLPEHFWNATPAELANALAPPEVAPGQGLSRTELDQLMELDNG